MAVIRVKTIGSGRQGDPFRASLPTYDEVLTNYSEGWTLVSLPDADLHDAPEKVDPHGHYTSRGHQILTLDDAGHAAWHKHLDERYQERRGEFRPEVV